MRKMVWMLLAAVLAGSFVPAWSYAGQIGEAGETADEMAGEATDVVTGGETDSKYEVVYSSYQGLRMVRVQKGESDFYGYIDEEGNEAIPCVYEYAEDFRCGPEVLVTENGRCKLIDTKGNTVHEYDPSYRSIISYNGKTAGAVNEEGYTAVIDRLGNPQGPFKYRYFTRYPANEELFLVSDVFTQRQQRYIPKGVVAPDGTELAPMVYIDTTLPGKGGALSLYSAGKLGPEGEEVKHGFLNAWGQEAVPFEYASTHSVIEGIGCIAEFGEENWKYAIINEEGELLTDYIFDTNIQFEAGAGVGMIDGQYYLIDRAGGISEEPLPINGIGSGFSVSGLSYEVDGKRVRLVDPKLAAERELNIYLNGEWLYTDQEPVLVDDRVLVPIRALATELDFQVDWDETSQTVSLQNRDQIVRFTIGSSQAVKNTFDDGVPPETETLDVPAQVVNGRTMIPLRFVSEFFSAGVDWQDGDILIRY